MSDDPIERIRLHIEKHKAKVQAPFSIAGLTALLDLLKVLTADNITLTAQRDMLKAQVDRLLAKEGERIGKELRRIERYE
jgi:uncharacterized protein YpuA (DUF1002 family)